MSELLEQQITGLNGDIEVLRVTALAQKQKGEATKPGLVLLERAVADLQAQLAGEQKSHKLTQVSSHYLVQSGLLWEWLQSPCLDLAVARQVPVYAAHIVRIRQQALKETGAWQNTPAKIN